MNEKTNVLPKASEAVDYELLLEDFAKLFAGEAAFTITPILVDEDTIVETKGTATTVTLTGTKLTKEQVIADYFQGIQVNQADGKVKVTYGTLTDEEKALLGNLKADANIDLGTNEIKIGEKTFTKEVRLSEFLLAINEQTIVLPKASEAVDYELLLEDFAKLFEGEAEFTITPVLVDEDTVVETKGLKTIVKFAGTKAAE